jgi:hypothetical protein
VKQVVSGTTGGWHGEAGGGENSVRREGSGMVAGNGDAPANFSSLTASIAKSSSL